jgi:hypothetical protein
MIVVERERERFPISRDYLVSFGERRRGRSFSGPQQISLSMAKPPFSLAYPFTLDWGSDGNATSERNSLHISETKLELILCQDQRISYTLVDL